MTDTNTASESDGNIDVEATESVPRNDADELEEELDLTTELIGDGLDYQDHGEAIQALKDFLDPENPPKSVHMTVHDEDDMQPAFFMNDGVGVKPQTEMMYHLANHLQEVSDLVGLSPAAAAFAAANVVEKWDQLGEDDDGE